MSNETVEEVPTVQQLITQVMAAIGPIAKTGQGDVPYKFRGIDQVMNALNPALVAHGLVIVPCVLETEHTRVNNDRAHMVMLTVAYDIYGPRGDSIRAIGIGESVDYSDKATNQAMSMAYKYAMLQTFHIPTEDMADGDASAPSVSPDVMINFAPLIQMLTPDERKGLRIWWDKQQELNGVKTTAVPAQLGNSVVAQLVAVTSDAAVGGQA